jgi:hypothetical protein
VQLSRGDEEVPLALGVADVGVLPLTCTGAHPPQKVQVTLYLYRMSEARVRMSA